MTSLINSMRWDEQRFGLEYDLDIYMIVAVDFFKNKYTFGKTILSNSEVLFYNDLRNLIIWKNDNDNRLFIPTSLYQGANQRGRCSSSIRSNHQSM
ncbi:peptidase, partial [Vibrio cholerae]|nr:peptidase [Vibrio cholerae]